jgi:hypothetical protein
VLERILVSNTQLALALLGTALLLWGAWLARRGRGEVARRFRDRALAALGLLGLLAFANFGRLNQGGFVHTWDTYHYFIGAKYFPELGYPRLYECTALADAQAGLGQEVQRRTMTDLHTNEQVSTLELLRHPERCTAHFSAARWESFKHDVAWFRDRMSPSSWLSSQRDHGYNATPVWGLLGHALADLAPASDGSILALTLIDPLLILAAFALLVRCFGWRVAAVAALMLGTYHPARFSWTGGAFLRYDWLFCAVAGLCALRKDRPFLAGVALAYAALLRLFPAALLVGPAVALIEQLWRTRRLPGLRSSPLRLSAGAALTVALALPLALATTGDWGRGFLENTLKHADTPLTNHMGLPTVLSYRPDTTVQELRERFEGETVWPQFTAERRQALHPLRPILPIAALLVLVLLWKAARQEPWRLAVLASMLAAVLLQLTCYYYVFVIAWAALIEGRAEAGGSRTPALADAHAFLVGALLLGMCAASMLLLVLLHSHVSTDVAYVAHSVVTLLGLGAVLVLEVRRGGRQPAAVA